MNASRKFNTRKGVLTYMGIATFLIFTVLCFNSCNSDNRVTIQPGEEGHMYRPSEGGFDEANPMYEGTYFVAPGDELIVYSLKSQKMTVELELMSSHGKLHDVTVEMHYAVKRGESARLHLEIGRGYRTILNDKLKGAAKNVIGRYTAEEIATTKAAVVQIEMKGILMEELNRMYLNLNYVEVIKLEAK